jgi:capsid protein
MQRPIPLRADYSARARNNWLERSVVASAISVAVDDSATGPAGIAKRMWGDGSVVDAICKGAVVPTSTATASALAGSAVSDYVASLSPISAGAKLIATAPHVSLDGVASLTIPARSGAIPSDDVLWVDEGSPIPVAQMALTNAAILTSKKLCVQAVLTRELAAYSAGEAVITQMLRESTAVALDASIFSTTAASTARPAGILAGIAAKTATAGGGDAAMLGDLELLSAAIADATSGLAYVCHPKQAKPSGCVAADCFQMTSQCGPPSALPQAR